MELRERDDGSMYLRVKSVTPHYQEEKSYRRPFTIRIVSHELHDDIMTEWNTGNLKDVMIYKVKRNGEAVIGEHFIRKIQNIYPEFDIYGKHCISIVFKINIPEE